MTHACRRLAVVFTVASTVAFTVASTVAFTVASTVAFTVVFTVVKPNAPGRRSDDSSADVRADLLPPPQPVATCLL